jgi:transposase
MTSSAPSAFLGIDVGKASLEVALLHPHPSPSQRRDAPERDAPERDAPERDAPEREAPVTQVANTPAGFDALAAWLQKLSGGGAGIPAPLGLADLHVCLEASGGYEQPVARWLHARGATVSVVNPRRTASYGDSLLRRSKTDSADARLIARFAQRERPGAWEPPAPNQDALKKMSRGLQQLKREQERLTTQRDRAGHDAVVEALDAVVDRIAEQIDHLNEQIDAHVQQCAQLRRRRSLLVTIPGVGRTTATRILAELGEPSRFESARQVAAYAGLTPSHHTSGTSVAKPPRLSKIGSSRLRTTLYFPAITALRCNRAVQALGDRLAERGKAKMVIIGAAMRKLLHICYGVLKNDEPFNAALHPGT